MREISRGETSSTLRDAEVVVMVMKVETDLKEGEVIVEAGDLEVEVSEVVEVEDTCMMEDSEVATEVSHQSEEAEDTRCRHHPRE